MGDYFRHWIAMRKKIKFPPRIFYVNWFRKDSEGKYLWPGYGENMRVLKWIVDRRLGEADADETPPGWVPGLKKFDLTGLPSFSEERFDQWRSISYDDWRREVFRRDEWFLRLYTHLPKELIFQRELLVARL